jgi:hypothetical protein
MDGIYKRGGLGSLEAVAPRFAVLDKCWKHIVFGAPIGGGSRPITPHPQGLPLRRT